MAIEVAKWCFLKQNPARTRSPRGLADGISFKLTGLHKGSAIPVISLESSEPTLPGMPPPFGDYFEQARDAIVGAIAAAEKNGSVIDHLPEKCLGYFDRIGRSLRAGESIEFTTTSREIPARLTRESRRTLVLASSRIQELTAEVSVRGSIPELDQDRMTFELQLIEGRKITGTVSDEHLDSILDAFNGFRKSAKVLIQGLGKYDRQDRLVRLQSIEHTALLDPLDVPARLDEFRQMTDGWLDGEGVAPHSDQLDWLADTFDSNYPDDLPLPHTFPTPTGQIEMEWTLGSHSVALEVDLGKRRGNWLSYGAASTSEETRSLDLNVPKDWLWLSDRIRGYSQSAK